MAAEINIAEYDAKAMLLGMKYAVVGHYFWKFSDDQRGFDRFDADTLVKLKPGEVDERRVRWQKK